MDRFHAMETFIRVIEAGSFSAAAKALRVGQPAVSKTVAALEERLGVRLLVRTTRQLTPTEAGQAYYERARRALDEAGEAETAARGAGAGLEGRLKASAPVTFARLHLAPKLGAFLDAHPRLNLDFIMDDRSVDLIAENVDVALKLGALADSSLTARKLSDSDRLVVASPEYLARAGVPKRPADLLQHQAIVYAQAAGGEEWRFKQGSAETSVRVPTRLSVSAAEGVREAVIAGIGLTIASRWMFARELQDGTVVEALTEWSLPKLDLWAVYPAGRLPTAKARAFVEWALKAVDRGA